MPLLLLLLLFSSLCLSQVSECKKVSHHLASIMQRSRPPNSRAVRSEEGAAKGEEGELCLRLGAHYKFTTDAQTCCCTWAEDEDEACSASVQRSSHRGAFVSTTTQCSLPLPAPLSPSLLFTIDINAVLCLARPFQRSQLPSSWPPSLPLPFLGYFASLLCLSCCRCAPTLFNFALLSVVAFVG